MKSRMTILTIGVDDLQRSFAFYRDGLGLQTKGIVGTEFEHGAVAFFDLQPNLKLAIFQRDDLAYDSGVARSGRSPTEFSIGHTLPSEQEVDALMKRSEIAGARIVKQPQKTFWGGYAGYFQDPDDHLWEIMFHPDYA
jgi:catechol 2,3-dioxygenase-like lactoylglutathione lyase family enzyme